MNAPLAEVQPIRHAAAKKPAMTPEKRLFSGIYPGGIVFADRGREKGGDWARLAFLPYSSLQVEFEKDCPRKMRAMIEADVKGMNLQPGQPFAISGNITITLGLPVGSY